MKKNQYFKKASMVNGKQNHILAIHCIEGGCVCVQTLIFLLNEFTPLPLLMPSTVVYNGKENKNVYCYMSTYTDTKETNFILCP